MTTEEYETTIRPALAKFCGYEYSEEYSLWYDPQGVSCYPSDLPDPLYNPADAWALLCTLADMNIDIVLGKYQEKTESRYYCLSMFIQKEGQSPMESLVSAAWEIMRQTAERPSGE